MHTFVTLAQSCLARVCNTDCQPVHISVSVCLYVVCQILASLGARSSSEELLRLGARYNVARAICPTRLA